MVLDGQPGEQGVSMWVEPASHHQLIHFEVCFNIDRVQGESDCVHV